MRGSPEETPVPVFLLAVGAALAVASIYYAQPMLGVLGAELHAAPAAVGLVPTLTQLGYALGLLFLAPLGDRFDRRKIIVVKSGVLCATLALAGSVHSIEALWLASLATGLTATLAQDIVPAAATLAPESRRGEVVGRVMTGLLLGILLSRVVSGFVAERFGWRTMFVAAGASIAILGVTMARRLPRFAPTTTLSYGALLGSLLALWRRHPRLRRAALAQALLSIAFSAFWSTLAVMLHEPPFQLGSSVAGAFGLAGAAGAIAAPVAGKLADRRGPEQVARLGAGLVFVAFAAMLLLPLLPMHGRLALLAVSTIAFDFGMQASLVSHQAIVYSLEPAARSRLNSAFFVTVFVGMASGAALGSQAFAHAGWTGVTVLAVAASALALVVRRRS